jgi:hypothetical protein
MDTTVNPRRYINDASNYPAKMTLKDAARILQDVYVRGGAKVCRQNGQCTYIPGENAGPGVVGCAFAVLTHPDLRPRLSAFNQCGADAVVQHCPLIAQYFSAIDTSVLSSIQGVHDKSGTNGDGRDLASRMMGAAHILMGMADTYLPESTGFDG